ncbi:MAG: TadE/TadG family type IV pilus assembly protein [Croceibacterium sp.]
MRTIFEKLRALFGCTSGNTTLLVAISLPMLLGGAGFGVDLAQWYMWKRELQYAVDQAAVAGAWAQTSSATQSTYVTRATQEFNANLSVDSGSTTTPVVQLANYAAGTNNSVVVHATMSRALPFSSMLYGSQPSIYAYAQASFSAGATFTSCLIATDPDDSGAITIGGSSILTAHCGLAALSNSTTSIIVNGDPTVDVGWILSAGGIDPWLKTHTNNTIIENASGLVDPFSALSPPNPTESQVARTYTCASTPASTVATVATTTTTTYSYWKGANSGSAVSYNYTPAKAATTSTTTLNNQSVPNGTTAGTTATVSGTATFTQIGGSGNAKIYEKASPSTTKTYSNVVVTPGVTSGTVQPGTYTNMKISCNTTFQTGVYILNGGGLQIDGQYQVNGSSVMFVLKNGAYIDINGGTNVNLTAIQASDLIARGVSTANANLLAGMLVFEDRASTGSSKFKINGNASTILNGTIYMPVSQMNFSGTAGVTSQCLMIAANRINITGNANMSTFCPAGVVEDSTVLTLASSVKLVV